MLLRISLLVVATFAIRTLANDTAKSQGFNFKNLIVFGDSYSDEDRASYIVAHNGSGPPPGTLLPPSNNTATGGFTWTRLVANDTGVELFNYAVSGAVISNELTPRFLSSINADFPSVLDYEVPAFLADVAFVNESTGTNTLYSDREANNTVYAMWIGTNDLGVHCFFDDSQVGSQSYNGQTDVITIRNYTEATFVVFDQLFAAGARKFVLMNLAPLQLSPLYGIPPPLGGGVKDNEYWTNKATQNLSEITFKMLEYTTLVNTLFNYQTPFELLIAKRYPGASISIFDVNALINDIYNHAPEFFPGEQGQTFNVSGFYHNCDLTGSNCVNQAAPYDTFLWYDQLHPTQTTMGVIAKEFVGVVDGVSKYGKYFGS